ncbi:MAG: beta-propeller fold lactonase family protein [Ilumatobacteraceae bacterium]
MSHQIHRAAAIFAVLAPLATLTFAGTASADNGRHDHSPSTIYTETNAASGNQVLAFRVIRGALTQVGTYDTGGLGAGTGLGSQSAIVVEGDHLLAVDAGSDQISLFDVGRDGSLELTDVESSGGDRPVSVTARGKTAYVVNAGDGTVNGFTISHDDLIPIDGSNRTLPGNGAAQIAFDRKGDWLVVTEKNTNSIDVLPVDRHRVAGEAVSSPSAGQTPFGFRIDSRNTLVVSNAAGGVAGASSVSSYRIDRSGTLVPISSAVANGQGSACWIELSGNQKYAFSANTGSGTISSYRVGRGGSLSLVDPVAATPGAAATDMIQVDNSLFALASGAHTITAHTIGGNGSLTVTASVSVPTGVAGLATN